MSFLIGVVLFALGIAISIALHEAGHLLTAKAFGMRVRRYFIGFGPTIFSLRRGETEYGLKAIPAGGFCDIAGMTALDEVTPEERPRAFFRKPTWQRVVVLSAGSAMHFLIGILLIFVLAVTSGLPNSEDLAVAGQVSCASNQDPATGKLQPCGPGVPTPAADAGFQTGDRIVSVADAPVTTWLDAVATIQAADGPTQIVVERDGREVSLTVDVAPVQRIDAQTGQVRTVGAIGLGQQLMFTYGPLAAVPATLDYTGTMFGNVWTGLKMFPEKIPRLIDAIGGGARDENTPVSVVGASIIGGDAAERGLWSLFVLLLALLNFFVGVFNLLPLLPLDGGHIAVNLYERVRDWARARLGKTTMPPVDYTRLLPLTYAVILVGGAISLLTLTADIVNPIRLPTE
ncbi:zinc metalloprotease [Pseudonocardia asaccharolytica DSM 44247 = NBRC 16224]|uniref:Zinc metalloprotease n=1 Tax=Pseudonocardia asaccharolytica DSM 44247 = NBRC 16224 TaxID=1123024 RepID=A0A511CZ22_9PSEU|nr:zinc metalloprotease [Pseudonocardia asaccharolytica DSM 44247 = NBRC 16224]